MADCLQFMIRVSGAAYKTIEQDAQNFNTTKSNLLNTVIKNYCDTFIRQKKGTAKIYEDRLSKFFIEVKKVEPNTTVSQNAIRTLSKRIADSKWDKPINAETLVGEPKNTSVKNVLNTKPPKEHFRFRLQKDISTLKMLGEGYKLFNDDREKEDAYKPTAKFFNALFEKYASLSEYRRYYVYYADRIRELKKYSDPSYKGQCDYCIAEMEPPKGVQTRTWLLRPYRITTPTEGQYPCLLAYTPIAARINKFMLVKIPLHQILQLKKCDDITADARISLDRMRDVEKLMQGKDNTTLDDWDGLFSVMLTTSGIEKLKRHISFKNKDCHAFASKHAFDVIWDCSCSRRKLHWLLSMLNTNEYIIGIKLAVGREVGNKDIESKYIDTILLDDDNGLKVNSWPNSML